MTILSVCIMTGIISFALTAAIYYRVIESPRTKRKEAERRRTELLFYLFKNRHIDILKMPTEDIIATAKKLDDYISGKK